MSESLRKSLKPSQFLILSLIVIMLSTTTTVWITFFTAEPSDTSRLVQAIIAVNAILLMVLSALIFRRLRDWKTGHKTYEVGSRLQRRMVWIFSLVTIIPTIVLGIFAALFFYFGIQSWFDEKVGTAVEESVAVAEAYLEEHKENIRGDVLAVAADLNRSYPFLAMHPAGMSQTLNTQGALRNLTEIVVFTPSQVVARSELSFSLSFERLPETVLQKAAQGNVVVLADDNDKIRALVQLDPLNDLFLMVGRTIDPRVLNHMVIAQGAVTDYRALQNNIGDLQIQFSMIFVMTVLLLLLSAIWYGFYTAMRMTVPITALIRAAEKVRGGDFSAQVDTPVKEDEIGILTQTFNRMTRQVERQRGELITANRQLAERKRFTEAVFAGVSAGVVALDAQGVISLNNRTAAELLQDDATQSMKGMPVTALLPECAALLDQVRAKPQDLAEAQASLIRKKRHLNLYLRVTAELREDEIEGFIVTFDDITELVSAQRLAAWSDVARRVAHEIKNPLTPITLSTERLRRKYSENLDPEERETFLRYVDTILRHVSDIGSIVEEFVSFARMPQAERMVGDLRDVVRAAHFSAQTAQETITHHLSLPDEEVLFAYDDKYFSQMLTNLLKNAAEALIESERPDPQIWLALSQDKKRIALTIEDNGPGLPEDLLDKLTEPYVTTRPKGTGLGLAIVRRQVEEHRGRLTLSNRPDGGARIRLTFPQS